MLRVSLFPFFLTLLQFGVICPSRRLSFDVGDRAHGLLCACIEGETFVSFSRACVLLPSSHACARRSTGAASRGHRSRCGASCARFCMCGLSSGHDRTDRHLKCDPRCVRRQNRAPACVVASLNCCASARSDLSANTSSSASRCSSGRNLESFEWLLARFHEKSFVVEKTYA